MNKYKKKHRHIKNKADRKLWISVGVVPALELFPTFVAK